jgi:hypothetical protein
MQDKEDSSLQLRINKPEGIRQVGRLAVRWLESLVKGLKIMDVRKWKGSGRLGTIGRKW